MVPYTRLMTAATPYFVSIRATARSASLWIQPLSMPWRGVTTVAIKGGIAAGPGGMLYVQSIGAPTAVLAISSQGTPSVLTSGDPLQTLDQFMTRAASGDILLADESPNVIHRVTPSGGVSTFLSQAQMEAANGGAVTPRGGIAFDSAGNFYLAESNAGNLLRFDPSLNGTVWIPASVVVALTGVWPNFNGGIAFEPMSQERFCLPILLTATMWSSTRVSIFLIPRRRRGTWLFGSSHFPLRMGWPRS